MTTRERQLITADGTPKYLSHDQGVRFCCAAELMKTELDTLLCLTFHYTGCRMNEVLAFKPKDISLSEGGVYSGTLKQRTAGIYRFIPVKKRFLRRLLKFVKEQNIQSHDLIKTFSRWSGLRRIQDCMEIAGITDRPNNSRTLRHSYAVTCKMEGLQLDDI